MEDGECKNTYRIKPLFQFPFHPMDYGLWTMDYGLWTMDYGLWTMDYGLFPLCKEFANNLCYY
jgi:hypothetical protein